MRGCSWIVAVFAASLLAGSATAAPTFVLPAPVQVTPLAAGAKVQPVGFARAAFQIAEGRIWAYEGATLVCRFRTRPVRWRASEWELDDTRLGSVFREEAALAGFVSRSNQNLFESGPSADRFQVAALITDMDGRFCGIYEYEPVPYSGELRMTVEWQVFDTLSREVVKRIPTTAGGEHRKTTTDGLERTFYAAFRENVRALLANGEFRDLVTAEGTKSATANPPILFEPAPMGKRPVASAADAVAAVFAGDGHGTGFLISSDGYLLTNHHVVGASKYVKVRWPDKSETLGEVVRVDRRRDVALIKLDAGGRKPLALRPRAATLGEAVYAVGTPIDQKFQGTVTKGIVSANRTYDGLAFIQSDVGINPGNSGGPLLDEAGAVLGVTVSGYQINGAPMGLNLFIPIGDALETLALKPAT